MACVVGKMAAIGWNASGRISIGSIIPPSSIEGRKISCVYSTTERPLVAITPISIPIVPKVAADSNVIRVKASQFCGILPSKIGAVRTIMAETISAWKMVDMAGIDRIDKAGTPSILNER